MLLGESVKKMEARGDDKLLSETSEDDNKGKEFWFEVIRWDDSKQDELITELLELNMALAKRQVNKEYNIDRHWKLLEVADVGMTDLVKQSVVEAVNKCDRCIMLFVSKMDQSGAKGTVKIFFRKRSDLEKSVHCIRESGGNVKLNYLETVEILKQKAGEKEFGYVFPAMDFRVWKGEETPFLHQDHLTLLTGTLPESVTEDDLWMLFPKASHIVRCLYQTSHAYIEFKDAEVLEESIEALKHIEQPVKLSVLKLVNLAESRKAFSIHFERSMSNTKNKAQKEQMSASLMVPADSDVVMTSPGKCPDPTDSIRPVENQAMSKSKRRKIKKKKKKTGAALDTNGLGPADEQQNDRGQQAQSTQSQPAQSGFGPGEQDCYNQGVQSGYGQGVQSGYDQGVQGGYSQGMQSSCDVGGQGSQNQFENSQGKQSSSLGQGHDDYLHNMFSVLLKTLSSMAQCMAAQNAAAGIRNTSQLPAAVVEGMQPFLKKRRLSVEADQGQNHQEGQWQDRDMLLPSGAQMLSNPAMTKGKKKKKRKKKPASQAAASDVFSSSHLYNSDDNTKNDNADVFTTDH